MCKDGIRVVIADDEPITRMDLKELLSEEGYQVVGEAADGFDAVEAASRAGRPGAHGYQDAPSGWTVRGQDPV